MKTKTISLFFVTLFIVLNTVGQTITIKGTIKDKETGEAIAYTSIYLKNKQTGCIANENGAFALKINSLNNTDTIVVHSIGYEDEKFQATQLARKSNNKILLTPKAFNLQAVEFRYFNLTDFVESVFDSLIFKYYPLPNLVSAYYKRNDSISLGNTIHNNLTVEAAFDMYSPKKNKYGSIETMLGSLKDDIYLKGLRVHNFTELVLQPEKLKKETYVDNSQLTLTLSTNKYLYKGIFQENIKKFDYQITKRDTINEDKIIWYIEGIWETADMKRKVNFVIDKNLKTVHEFYFTSQSIDNNNNNNDSIVADWKQKCIYREENQKMIPVYFYFEDNYFSYPKTGKGYIYRSTSKNELLVNQIQPCLPNTKPEGIKLDNSKSIEYQKVKYDSVFWSNYIIIEPVVVE